MSGTTDHEAAVADLPENTDKFFFSLQADENGVTELKFRKQRDPLFGVLLFAMDFINQSFDEPYQTTSEFIAVLAEVAEKIEANRPQEAANDEPEPQAPEAA